MDTDLVMRQFKQTLLNIPRRQRMMAVALSCLAVMAGCWYVLDVDGDGLTAGEEFRIGTSPVVSDTDGDGAVDGAEYRGISDPLWPDTDRDGLTDGQEIWFSSSPIKVDSDGDTLEDAFEFSLKSDPLSADTDGDLILDAAEDGSQDCDEDGIFAVNDPDDDEDGLTDGQEHPAWRCDLDFDKDEIGDGSEQNFDCVSLVDCDLDGLIDSAEKAHGANELVANSLHKDFADGVLVAFEDASKRPGEDRDRDGIPDNWETAQSPVEWHGLQPALNRTDFLVEFVRVQDPHSDKVSALDMRPVYGDLATLFAEDGNISMTWKETWINFSEMQRAPMIPSAFADYYSNLLPQTQFASNPYVTTVVLNPQHDQSKVLHAGAAPIRGMLAAIDYGAHASVTYGIGYNTFTMTPLYESIIDGHRDDLIEEMGFIGYGHDSGRMHLEYWDFVIQWTPYWFASNPIFISEDGTTAPSYSPSWSLDFDGLAVTTLHELGHTLGLCHTHEPDCLASLSERDQYQADESVMSYEHEGDLHFLPSEWSTIKAFLACPPQRAVAALAQNVSASEMVDIKYAYALANLTSVNVRQCGTFASLTTNITGSEALPYVVAGAVKAQPPSGGVRSAVFFAVAMIVGVVATWATGRYPVQPTTPNDQQPVGEDIGDREHSEESEREEPMPPPEGPQVA